MLKGKLLNRELIVKEYEERMQLMSKWKNRRLPGCLVIGYLFLCVLSFAWGQSQTTDTVRRGNFVQTLSLTGTLVAEQAEEFFVPRTSSWQIQIKWMAEEGVVVEPGDVVVRFDNASIATQIEDLAKNLEDKKEQLLMTRADQTRRRSDHELSIKRAEVSLDKAEIDASLPHTLVSDHEFRNRQIEVTKCRSELEMTREREKKEQASMKLDMKRLLLEITRDEEKLAGMKSDLAALSLSARTSGAFLYANHPWQDRNIQIGDTVGATAVVATIPHVQSMRIEAWAQEADILLLVAGQSVKIILDAYPGKELSGTVHQVGNKAEEKSRWGSSRYFSVFINLDRIDQDIMKPGMSVLCRVKVKEHKGVLLVPLERVRRQDNVFVVKPRGKKKLVITPVGANYFSMAIEDTTGLGEGDRLE